MVFKFNTIFKILHTFIVNVYFPLGTIIVDAEEMKLLKEKSINQA